MTRLAEGYDTRNFPYAEILGEITQETVDKGLLPVEAYLRFLTKRDRAGLSHNFDYASTAISSAGHSRQAKTVGLSMGQIIAANTDSARQVVGLMDRQRTLVGKRVVLPVDLGNTGWSQSNFMLYWGLTIAGPDLREQMSTPGALDNFEHRLGNLLTRREVDLEIMNNSSLERGSRETHYLGFVTSLATTVRDTDVTTREANSMISLIDPQASLGCSAEAALADKLDIPRMRIAAMSPGDIGRAVPVPTLRENMQAIMAMGGQILIAQKESLLVPILDTGQPPYEP